MSDNELTNCTGDSPLEPWAPNEPLDHHRLNRMQSAPVNSVTVRGAGARVVRTGSAVAILLQDRGGVGVGLKLLQITDERTGGGKYQVSVLDRPAEIDSAEDVSADDFGASINDEATAINLLENGLSTHKLTHASNTLQIYCLGLPWGQDEDGRDAYLIVHFWTKGCT